MMRPDFDYVAMADYEADMKESATLSAAQKKDLRFSFQKQGYEVNTKTIGNFRYEPLATSPGFCFPD